MMEALEHRSSSDVGGSKTVEAGDPQSSGSQGGSVEVGLDTTSGGLQEERQTGPLEVFHPGGAAEEQPSSVVAADTLRCQVKITTRRSLHLRIANHTAQDVYVRLVGREGLIAGTSVGQPRNALEQSKHHESEIYEYTNLRLDSFNAK